METISNEIPAQALLYHKQSTSARTRFLRMPYGGICALGALPKLSVVGEGKLSSKVHVHPAMLISQLQEQFSLPDDSLEHDGEFQVWLDTNQGAVPVYLLRFTAIDPPFDEVERLGGKFIALTEARGLPSVELELLQHAYRAILG